MVGHRRSTSNTNFQTVSLEIWTAMLAIDSKWLLMQHCVERGGHYLNIIVVYFYGQPEDTISVTGIF